MLGFDLRRTSIVLDTADWEYRCGSTEAEEKHELKEGITKSTRPQKGMETIVASQATVLQEAGIRPVEDDTDIDINQLVVAPGDAYLATCDDRGCVEIIDFPIFTTPKEDRSGGLTSAARQGTPNTHQALAKKKPSCLLSGVHTSLCSSMAINPKNPRRLLTGLCLFFFS